MKFIFKFNQELSQPLCVRVNHEIKDNKWEYVAIYVGSLTLDDYDGIYSDLTNSSIKYEYVGTDHIDAFIYDENVKIGWDLYEDGREPEGYDVDNAESYLISRSVLIFLVDKWFQFLGKSIIDPNYQEIIYSEDAYK